jgi:NAD(P)-dependent dehydrogenase (short-subunit alcohol dehydrogenase family)
MTQPDPFDLSGRAAIVTGAGSVGAGWGNGKATSVTLARRGARVLCVDIEHGRAMETVDLIQGEGGTAESLVADVTTAAGAAQIVERCLQGFGRIDILINNVGGSEPGDALSMTEEVWDRQFQFNLKTVFLMSKAVLPTFLAQKSGVIVNLGSIIGLRYIGRDSIAYAASKAAVIEYTRQTALRFARDGIRCNTVVPGLMHTPLVEARLAGQYTGGDASALIQRRHDQVPMGKMGDAWDVANAVLYLASDASRHVTGTEIVVDGGLQAATIPFETRPRS